MNPNLDELYANLMAVYKKETDQDFPTNKIRFFMDFLWNAMLSKPLTEEQKNSLKQLIDLLNSLDDHKLSPTRDMITSLGGQLNPLLQSFPSLGHTFTFVVTTLIPAYQRYLTSLESQVKESHAFTKDEVLLYYDMTLVDHAVLSHLFESETQLNLLEVITSIKTVIIANALTHDYLQDAMNRSISLFTFLQRGGLAKDHCLSFYEELIADILTTQKASVSNDAAIKAVEFLCGKLQELARNAVVPPEEVPAPEAGSDSSAVAAALDVPQAPSITPVTETPSAPSVPQVTEVLPTPPTSPTTTS
ncbi:MAG: hypothetical protein ABI758_01610 [Candidatus Woesebacteria bacterium]